MISPEQMRSMQNEAARRAKSAKRIPLLVEQHDLGMLHEHFRGIPNFGDYRPATWEEVHARDLAGDERYSRGYAGDDDQYLFVDKTGWGSPSEPALTFGQFCQWASERGAGYGYAMIEEGQCQVVVGVFKRKARARRSA